MLQPLLPPKRRQAIAKLTVSARGVPAVLALLISGSTHVFPARRLEHVGLFYWVLRISSKEAARLAAPWALLTRLAGAFRERVVTKAVSTVWLAQMERAPD